MTALTDKPFKPAYMRFQHLNEKGEVTYQSANFYFGKGSTLTLESDDGVKLTFECAGPSVSEFFDRPILRSPE